MAYVPIALTIAGSDSGAGAGVQADLKTFAAFQVYGASALTAITAQNTLGVTGIEELSPEMVGKQVDAIVSDLGVDAIKTGMLSNVAIIRAVVGRLEAHALRQVVVDPVMVAKGGDHLLREDAVEALRTELLPKALVVTPNAEEAEVLSGRPVTNLEEAKTAAKAIAGMGPRYVVVKGGHFGDDATDILFNGTSFREYRSPRVETTSTHGTGCTFASAIAAGLAWGLPMEEAVANAKEYVYRAIINAFPVGHGQGPLNHFHEWWRSPWR
jgi:hydroxymethylpyrimidine/phosphomethylpyrimidine kinase